MFSIEHLHPMIVHFPIVLAILLVAIDAVALARDIPLDGTATYANFSLATALLAGLGGIAAAVLGDMAYDVALEHGVPVALLESHEGLGTTTGIVLAVWAGLRLIARWRGMAIAGGRKTLLVTAEAAIVALVLATAYLGGNLVYDHGVAVALGS